MTVSGWNCCAKVSPPSLGGSGPIEADSSDARSSADEIFVQRLEFGDDLPAVCAGALRGLIQAIKHERIALKVTQRRTAIDARKAIYLIQPVPGIL